MIKAAVIGGTECINDKIVLVPLWDDYDILIISYLHTDLLTKSALGFETVIVNTIKMSKNVYLLKNATKHINKLPKPLILLYNSYIDTLKTFSVKLIDCTDEIFMSKKAKKLLTTADLEGFEDTIFKVSAKTIITPLAFDFARENNITITRDDSI